MATKTRTPKSQSNGSTTRMAQAMPRADREHVELYVRTLAEMTTGVRDALPALSPVERMRMVKPGPGAALVIPELAELADEVSLRRVGDRSVSSMVEQFERARVLGDIAKHAEAFSTTLKDAQLRA